MGEDDRGTSGSSTVLIVLAILGGVLLVCCLGGLAAFASVLLSWESQLSR